MGLPGPTTARTPCSAPGGHAAMRRNTPLTLALGLGLVLAPTAPAHPQAPGPGQGPGPAGVSGGRGGTTSYTVQYRPNADSAWQFYSRARSVAKADQVAAEL